MNNSIYPCITLKGKVEEASKFYIDTFGAGKVTHTSQYVIMIELSGQKFMLLNEGPVATPSAAISFMVTSEDPDETESYWNKLIEGGKTFMPLDQYPWSAKYGWVEDKYGVSWQLFTSPAAGTPQKFAPSIMFIGENAGKAREAIDFYTSIFPQSDIESLMEYGEDEQDHTGWIKHGRFHLYDVLLTAMDSSATFDFEITDGVSLVVNCDSQAEIDQYWNVLTADGGQEVGCGWLTDKYGLSWQIVPKALDRIMSDPDRRQRAMAALVKMKKLIIADLENA